jgi:hypothetical protein
VGRKVARGARNGAYHASACRPKLGQQRCLFCACFFPGDLQLTGEKAVRQYFRRIEVPARDLGPRIAHAILPSAGKGGSDWGCAAIPVFGPLVGGALAGILLRVLHIF